MAVQTAFTSVAPRLAHSTHLKSGSAVCGAPAPCCGVPHAPSAPCGLRASRRSFVSGGVARGSFLPAGGALAPPLAARARTWRVVRAAAEPAAAAGAKVLSGLLQENAEFVKGNERIHADVIATRDSLAGGQAPPVAVIACADSRVAPEIMFRAGLGELFVMRVAGNTATGAQVLGSLQYAVDVLGVKLVMVLGHTKCGAVAAACANADLAPAELKAHVGAIARDIDSFGGLHSNVDRAVAQNVQAQVALLNDDMAKRGVKDPPLITGAVYDIESGRVSVVEADVGAALGA